MNLEYFFSFLGEAETPDGGVYTNFGGGTDNVYIFLGQGNTNQALSGGVHMVDCSPGVFLTVSWGFPDFNSYHTQLPINNPNPGYVS